VAVERYPPKSQAAGDADRRPQQRLADEFPTQPPQQEVPDLLLLREEDRRVDERERQGVVEARFRGQGEPHLVALPDVVEFLGAGSLDLDIRGEHRIGGRQRRAQQQGRARTKPQHPHPEDPGPEDRQRHPDGEQPPRRMPAPPRRPGPQRQRAVQGQPDTHQRHDHRELGQVLDGGRVRRRVDVETLRQRHGSDAQADEDQDDGGRQRDPTQQDGQDDG